MARVPFVLTHWNPLFDASKEESTHKPIWVRIFRLPIDLWSLGCFKVIGNVLGTFLDVDMYFEVTRNKSMVRVLVILDICDRFMEDIYINTSTGPIIHILDYECIPFHCHRCHQYVHLLSQCKFPFYGWSPSKGHSFQGPFPSPLPLDAAVQSPSGWVEWLGALQGRNSHVMTPRRMGLHIVSSIGVDPRPMDRLAPEAGSKAMD